MDRFRCFFDVEVDEVPLGRIIFELFNDACPKTCENFRALCTGKNIFLLNSYFIYLQNLYFR